MHMEDRGQPWCYCSSASILFYEPKSFTGLGLTIRLGQLTNLLPVIYLSPHAQGVQGPAIILSFMILVILGAWYSQNKHHTH